MLPQAVQLVLMDSELQGWERKCRKASKHRTSGNIMHFGHDPVNYQSDYAKQACDCRGIAGRDRFMSSDSLLDYSRRFENAEAVFTVCSPQPDSATEADPD
jgi:hypothetical protein